LLVVMTFTQMEESAASNWKPRTATLAEGNRRIVRLENPDVPTSLLTTFQR
jgi:aspartate 1-decarboxylase